MRYIEELRGDPKFLTGPFGRVAVLSLNARLTSHAHSQCNLIIKLDGPDQSFCVEGRDVPLTDERAVVINRWQEHCYVPGITEVSTTYLALYIEPDWLAQGGPEFEGFDAGRHLCQASVPISRAIRSLARQLGDLVCAENPTSGLAGQLIIGLMREVVRADLNSHLHPCRSDYRIRRALNEMQGALDTPFDFDAVARNAGLSRSRFNVLFKEMVGVGPAIYGNALRLEAALAALAARSKAKDVADDLGFSSAANFSRFFQQHTGVPPGKFQKFVLTPADLTGPLIVYGRGVR